jgi:hypothetical protein
MQLKRRIINCYGDVTAQLIFSSFRTELSHYFVKWSLIISNTMLFMSINVAVGILNEISTCSFRRTLLSQTI